MLKTIINTHRSSGPRPGAKIAFGLAMLLTVMLGAAEAGAAIGLEQTANNVIEGSDTVSATFAATPAAGNLLVAIAGNRSASDPPPTPAGWTLVREGTGNAPGQLIFYRIAGAAEPTTVTLGPYSATSNRGLHIYEYSGVDTSSPLGSTQQVDGTGTSVFSGSVTTGGDGALVIVGITTDANTSFSGWTNGFNEQNDFINGGVVASRSTYAGAHLIAGAAGTYSTTATLGASGLWMGQAAVFNAIPVVPSDYTVVNTNDTGAGSLRAAIDYANLNPGANILFDIPDTDPGYQTSGTDHWWRIAPLSALPVLTADAVTIDGATQTANRGDTNTRGPEIELHGGSAGTADGLTLNSTGNAVSGLVISGFNGVLMAGIRVTGATASGNAVTGCYIGTDALGNSALGNYRGIWVQNGATSTTIGGPNVGDGNVLSGNGSLPILADIGCEGITIKGNRIGTNAAGDAALPNSGAGLYANGSSGVVVGGPGANEGNLVSGNTSYGLWFNNVDDLTIQGNIIGTDLTVTTPLGNGNRGVYIQGTVATGTIGGAAAGEGNIISANGGAGLTILASIANLTVRGNMIGTGLTGTESGLGNIGSPGINLGSSAIAPTVIVGGLGPGEGNVIADNGDYGIVLGGADVQVLGNEIRGNAREGLRSSADRAKIVGNLIIDNGTAEPGIYVGATGTDQEIYHNTIHGSGGDGIEVLAVGTVIRNNIVTGSGGYGINVNGGAMTESNNDVTGAATSPANALGRSNVALDAGDLDADPLYVDAVGGDFALTECTSPAINTGLDLGVDQPDMNGIDPGNYNGVAPDMGALESGCSAIGVTISGRVFEDADFAGTASEYDGGTVDLGLAEVDVELYDGTDSYLESATTDAAGNYSFTGLVDGDYKVRVRSVTLGDVDTPPAGGLNPAVPATWPYPLPELAWANGAALYGGQVPTVDDTDTGDDAGPGDTWVAVTVSGANASGVNFGFAYNLIVHTGDDGLADASRSGQGGLRQFLKNANAIGATGGTTASSSEFRMQVAANGSDGADTWWRISPIAALPALTDPGTVIDGATQTTNSGDSNSRGPEIEIYGATVPTVTGLTLTSADHQINGLVVNGFSTAPGTGVVLDGASATGIRITGCYVGTNAVGETQVANFYGISLSNGPSGTVIGGSGAGEGNVVSGNTFYGLRFDNAGANTTIRGNRIGTNATGDAAMANSIGLYIDGGTAIVIGGPGVGEGNLISGNISSGMNLQFGDDVTIQGNWMGLNLAGTDPLPDGGTAIYGWSVDNVTIGGSAPGEGNIIAGNDGFGISLGSGCQRWVIQGNNIGVGPLGTETNLGNTGAGNVRVSPNDITIDATIGGENPGEGNLIAYASGPGISCVSLGAAVEIIGNVIRNNAEEGITARVDSLTVALNVIRDNGIGFDAILIQDVASDGRVYQNTIHGSGDDGIEIVGPGHEVRNNIVTGSAGYGINLNAGTMTESNNLVTGAATSPANALGAGNVALDPGDLDVDPLYVDAAGGDFSLTECSSPAINTGLDLGVDQPDVNGGDAGLFTGPAPDMGAIETTCVAVGTDISGRVFEDADFAGTASGWDGGAGDAGQPAVDVELYTAADVFVATTTTDGTGSYNFSAVADGSYKVRVRAVTLGDADTPPAGGLNPTVPATWPYPLPELAWANGAALYGGQVATVDDTDTGDDAGPGDTWIAVTVSGVSVTGVDFGFAYNLIVHTGDDGLADASRSGQGGLRQFLKNANAIGAAGGTTANTSQFRLLVAADQAGGGGNWWRISPVTALPDLADGGTVLDAATQVINGGGASNPNGPDVELDGTGAGAVNGLMVTGDGSVIRALVIGNFGSHGVDLAGDANTVTGCRIGVDAVGTGIVANAQDGIIVTGASNVIGGTGATDGNVISGNGNAGVYVTGAGAAGTVVQGNIIGLDATGTALSGNGNDGIILEAVSGVLIGGTAAGAGNVLSGNLDPGNLSDGLWITGGGSHTVQGNWFGTDATGTLALGNFNAGMTLTNSSDNLIGGTAPGAGNVIAHNGNFGVNLLLGGTGNSILGNAIFGAGGLGIDLDADGVTANDPGDGDAGVNDLQNHPVLGSAVTDGSSTVTIAGSLNSVVGTTYRIEFFSNVTADPSGYGEGETYLGSVDVTTDGVGDAGFSVPLAAAVPAGRLITATATSPDGDTSEFCAAIETFAGADLQLAKFVDTAMPAEGDTVTYTITLTNAGPGDATGIEVTDLLPAGVTYVSDTTSQGSYLRGTGLWAVGAQMAAQNDTLTLVATVDTGTGGTTLTNTATVTASDQPDPVAANDTAQVDMDVRVDLSALIRVTAVPLEIRPLQPGGPADEALRLELTNQGTGADTLRTLTIANASTGAGTAAQLDADWQGLSLLVDSSGLLGPPATAGEGAITTGVFSAGTLTFSGLAVALAPGETIRLVVMGSAALGARDGDLLSVSITGSGAVSYAGTAASTATWPLATEGVLVVDGMVADQLDLRAVDASLFVIGSVRNLALDVGLPANGYEGDQLDRLNVINLGNARDITEISRMEAWADEGDGAFDPLTDTLLGEFAFTGSRWELTGLTHVVPLTRLRVYVTVDIAETAVAGRAFQLGLPTLPDVGIGMVSGNDGPIDREVVNPFTQTVSAADRVLLSSGMIVPGTVSPGQAEVPLLHLVALNAYAADRRLVELTVTNGTDGPGAPSVAQRDGELDRLSLRVDGDGDGLLGDLVSDPVIATGSFGGAEVTFTGLTWDLPAGATSHLFLTGDVSLTAAADGDVISAWVAGGIDLDFATATTVAASWPLDSGAQWTVDGMVASQIGVAPMPAVTLAAGEGPALIMDLLVPANGYAADGLAGLRFVNLGTAGPGDLADLHLWQDGGDGIFSAGGGDDVDLGSCIWVIDAWHSPVLDVALPPGGLRLFVGLTVAAAPTDGATVRLAVPMGAISVASGNDGPRDLSVENPTTTLLSTAPLLVEMHFVEPASTVGQTVAVRMRVRNVGGENLLDVVPQALVPAGDGVLMPAGGPIPASFDLAGGAVDSFTWTYTATASGGVTLTGSAQGTGAVGGQLRASLPATSGEHLVFDPASSLEMYAVANMPFSVVRGQTDVVPLSLTFINPGGADRADALIHSLRISLKDDTGAGIVPADLLSRVVVNEGGITYLDRTDLETVGDEIDLTLVNPVPVTGLEPVTLSLRLDIQPATAVPVFLVEITADTWFDASDAVSGAPVPIVLQDGSYPIRSGLGTLLVEATGLQVSATASGRQQVGFGQRDVTLLAVELLNPGAAGLGSEVRVGSLAFSLTDTLGTPLALPSQVLDRLRLTSPLQTLLDVSLADHDSTVVVLDLSSPLTVPVDTPLELTLVADVADPALAGAVQARLADAADFLAFDGNSGAALPVTYGADPVAGDIIVVQQPAGLFLAAGAPLLPSDLVIGANDVPAIAIDLRHPGVATEASILVESLLVQSRNGNRELMSPAGLIDGLVVLRAGVPVGSISNPVGDGNMTIPLVGVSLQPGQTVALTLSLDLEPTAPSGSLELQVPGAGLVARDANLAVVVSAQPEVGEEFPLTSGVTRLLESADELLVGFESLMPAVLVDSPAEIPAARVSLRNPDLGELSGIDLASVTVRAADDRLVDLPVGSAVEEILLYDGDQVWATSGILAPADQLGTLAPAGVAFIGPGVTLDLELRVRFRSPPTVPSLCLGIAEGDVLIVQPAGATVTVRVEPEDGYLFPYWTETGSFTGASLANSYSNFPNPFGAGREATTFVFALDRPATVSLKLLTAHARPVVSLIDNESRDAGLYQQDTWDGRNGRGVVVQNGVYIAELVAIYADGSKVRHLRKVAVVR